MAWPNLSPIDVPNAVNADEWTKRLGKTFGADLQFAGLYAAVAQKTDKPRGAKVAANNEKRIRYLIEHHGAEVVAYHLAEMMGPGTYSLQLQFKDKAAAAAARATWNKLHNGSIKV